MAKRVDSNQSAMVGVLRKAGLHVVHLHALGKGVPDILVSGYHHGLGVVVALLVEIKTATGKLTPDEMVWRNEYPPDGPYLLARSADDVFRWFEMV